MSRSGRPITRPWATSIRSSSSVSSSSRTGCCPPLGRASTTWSSARAASSSSSARRGPARSWSRLIPCTSTAGSASGRDRRGRPAATAFEQTLDYELKPLGISVRPAVLFAAATNKQFDAAIGKVIVGGTRGLPKAMRGRGEPVLGPETIVRLAVAADRLRVGAGLPATRTTAVPGRARCGHARSGLDLRWRPLKPALASAQTPRSRLAEPAPASYRLPAAARYPLLLLGCQSPPTAPEAPSGPPTRVRRPRFVRYQRRNRAHISVLIAQGTEFPEVRHQGVPRNIVGYGTHGPRSLRSRGRLTRRARRRNRTGFSLFVPS